MQYLLLTLVVGVATGIPQLSSSNYTTDNHNKTSTVNYWNPFNYISEAVSRIVSPLSSLAEVIENGGNFTPQAVQDLANSTYNEGANLFDDISEQFEDIAQNETLVHFLKLEKLGEETYFELSQIIDNLTSIIDSGEVTESQQKEEEQRLSDLKLKLRDLENEVENDFASGNNEIEYSLQNILREMRETMTADNLEYIWSKVKRAELQTYRATEVVTKSITSLSDIVSSFFTTIDKIENRYITNKKPKTL